MTSSPSLPISVVIPTIGRNALLRHCLASVLACDPPADEVLVVDQSGATTVQRATDEFGDRRVRVIRCEGRGIARATNLGLRQATHDQVLVTHDDCTVSRDWIVVAARLADELPGGIVTGRVLPENGADHVPSIKSSMLPEDFTGQTILRDVLFANNMLLSRSSVTEIGGFDEREGLALAAEDNDMCYRWLRAGHSLRFEPDLLVWHHDWRTPSELIHTNIIYKRSQGVLYAKLLRSGESKALTMLWRDFWLGWRSLVAGIVRRYPRWKNPERETIPYLLVGLVRGWVEARQLERTSPPPHSGDRSPL